MSATVDRAAIRDDALGHMFWLDDDGDLVCAPLSASGTPEFYADENYEPEFDRVAEDHASRLHLVHAILLDDAGHGDRAKDARRAAARYEQAAGQSGSRELPSGTPAPTAAMLRTVALPLDA